MRAWQQLTDPKRFEFPSVYSLLVQRAKETPGKEFIISLHNAGKEVLTYAQFLNRVIKVRRYLDDLRMDSSSAITVVIPNSADLLVIQYAAQSLGMLVVPVNFNFAPKEIAYVINDSCPELVVFDREYLDKIKAVEPLLVNKPDFICLSRFGEAPGGFSNIYDVYSDDTIIEKNVPDNKAALDTKALVIYTSGTSGNPKGCILTHRNMLADGEAIADWFQFNSNTKTLCLLPLFHNNGQIPTFLAPLWAGGSAIFSRKNINFIEFWDLVHEYSVTWSSVIPTILSVLLNLPNERKDSTMRGIICGGALLPSATQQAFESRFDVPVYEGYGLTETTSFSTFNPLDKSQRKIGSVGQVLPVNEVAVLDEDGNEVPDGEIGELCIHGYNVFLEYNKLPAASEYVFRGGWFHSGDFGFKDAEGFFFFGGRKDDLIIRGGENIYPREIENILYNHPKVKECVIVGVPHKLMGEEMVLFAETVDGIDIPRLELMNFCAQSVAKYKVPGKIFYLHELPGLKELPKGPTKKILRKEMRRFYLEHLANDVN